MATATEIKTATLDDLANAITSLFQVTAPTGSIIDIFDPTAFLGGMAGLLTVLKASLSAPLVTLYQISAEVVVMIALIMFISYVGTLIGVDVFGFVDDGFFTGTGATGFTGFTGFTSRRDDDEQSYTHHATQKRSASSTSFWDSPIVQKLSERVHSAIDKFSEIQ